MLNSSGPSAFEPEGPMEFRDHYAVLGVPPGATPEQVERAYKLLARISHPDAFPSDSQAQWWANERMIQDQ